MKNLIFYVLISISIYGCQKVNSESSDLTFKKYFYSSSIPAVVMGTIDVNVKTTCYHFVPSIGDD